MTYHVALTEQADSDLRGIMSILHSASWNRKMRQGSLNVWKKTF